jgi:sulfate/thiosulfate transport system substrate-binding protein
MHWFQSIPVRRILASFLLAGVVMAGDVTLLNVSYDPTRELYDEVNKLFAAEYKAKSGHMARVQQSHGGSGKQARSVIDGLQADVVTLALAYDIDAIAERKLIEKNWQQRLPNNSCPYTSTIVLLVRRGNPKQIKDWADLARPGIKVITPNPKTSGGARWNYLAAYGYELKRSGGNEKQAQEFVGKVFSNVPIFDTGARGATVTFLQRNIGDVLIAWENEAILAAETMAKGEVEIVYPSISIRAEPPVAVVDRNTKRRKTEKAAADYLSFLYAPSGQEVIAKHHFRPHQKAVAEKYKGTFPEIAVFTVDEMFGGWMKAHKAHFVDGGTFDRTQTRK